jgi:hypothetical protein
MIEKEIESALNKVKEVYGVNHAKRLEQLFRNETAHFKSGNFLKTLSAGMEVGAKVIYPYGWSSLFEFWENNPQYKPTGTHSQAENTSALAKKRGVRTFIKFGSVEASMMTVAHLIKLRGGNFGRWFATQDHPDKIQAYNDELDKIKVRIVK